MPGVDYRLLTIAFVAAAVSSFAIMIMAARGARTRGRVRAAWIAAAGAAVAGKSWAPLFVTNLALTHPLLLPLDDWRVSLSVVVAMALGVTGWAVAIHGDRPRWYIVGGVIAGLAPVAVSLMTCLPSGALNEIGSPLFWGVIGGVTVGAHVLAFVWILRRPTIKRGVAAGILLTLGTLLAKLVGNATTGQVSVPLDQPVFADQSSLLIAFVIAVTTIALAIVGILAALFDNSMSHRHAREMRRMRQLNDASFEGIVVVRDGLISEVNKRFCELTQLKPADLIGCPFLKVTADCDSSRLLSGSLSEESVECRVRCRDGSSVAVQVRSRPIEYASEMLQVYAFRDISKEDRVRAQMTHMAHHDALTGLPNRIAFRKALEKALDCARQADGEVAVLCLDLDRFKEVNDIHGHAMGDELLKAVAGRLLDGLPKHAIAARLGGDEFAVVIPDTDRESAQIIAERLVNSVGSPAIFGTVQLNVSSSGGITYYPMNGECPERLMNQADLALYRAKGQGRNRVSEYDPGLDRIVQERRALETALADVIEEEGLDLHFQPQLKLGTGEICGYEALVRWEDPERGFVPPSEFVQLAEETGMILRMGQWVLERACREAVNWTDGASVSVNVSPAQFRQGNLVLAVQSALKATGLDPRRLEIEITEGVLIDDEERAQQILKHLKALGVGVSMDDFGTGFASLNYLRAFPFDKIKLDRSFMCGLHRDREAQIIVSSTLDLARQLGLGVVVEGVETLEELGALGDHPEVVMQGYLLSKPMRSGRVAGFAEACEELRSEIRNVASGCAHPQSWQIV